MLGIYHRYVRYRAVIRLYGPPRLIKDLTLHDDIPRGGMTSSRTAVLYSASVLGVSRPEP
jgi:hypothetical protein